LLAKWEEFPERRRRRRRRRRWKKEEGWGIAFQSPQFSRLVIEIQAGGVMQCYLALSEIRPFLREQALFKRSSSQLFWTS
jgi:hypothetical protein